MKKRTPLWCEGCRFVCFETGLGKPMLTLNDPNRLKNTTNVYSIHLELRTALPCQINVGKWKYVNPCLDFLGISDQRAAYVKRRVRPGWTYVRRSNVTPDLFNAWVTTKFTKHFCIFFNLVWWKADSHWCAIEAHTQVGEHLARVTCFTPCNGKS